MTTDFIITKVKEPIPPRFVDVEVLKKCSAGLSRKIRYGHYKNKEKFKIIKDEIDFLINSL